MVQSFLQQRKVIQLEHTAYSSISFDFFVSVATANARM